MELLPCSTSHLIWQLKSEKGISIYIGFLVICLYLYRFICYCITMFVTMQSAKVASYIGQKKQTKQTDVVGESRFYNDLKTRAYRFV